MSIIVFGSDGQVGSHLRYLLKGATFLTRKDVDLLNLNELTSAIRSLSPDLIINCAAYTDVDGAESEPAVNWAINVTASAAIAEAAQKVGAGVIHLSTDYVFDGRSTTPYKATDPVNPQSVYGKSKLGGELAISAIADRYVILRVSWVFSEFGNNFVKTMLRLGQVRAELKVVNDQQGRPTYAGDLARAISDIISGNELTITSGIYHLSGGPETNWCSFAEHIFACAKDKELIEFPPEIAGIPTVDYPTPAERPRNSVLAPCALLNERLSFTPDWRRGLISALESLVIEVEKST